MAYRGRYVPSKPHKYKGDISKIVYRSGLELRFMKYCDMNNSIVEWSSEEIIIPYYSPVDRKRRRYFPDFYIKAKKPDGTFEKILIEIKPDKQTSAPKQPKKNTQKTKRRYLKESLTYVTNSAKWEAAINFCEKNDWKFKIITEKDLNLL